MFFNRNKKQKLDAKVRFQHRQFTAKLDKARNFKRTAKAIPENKIDQFLSKIYLGSRWSQIGVGLLFIGLIYIVYVPNFLSLQKITVSGLPENEQKLVEAAIRQSIAGAPFYDPQHNIIFLNDHRVETATLSVQTVFEVRAIEKNIKEKSLSVQVIPKFERFVLNDTEKVHSIYNDGSLITTQGVVAPMSLEMWDGFSDPKIVKIKTGGKLALGSESVILGPPLREGMETVIKALHGLTGSTFAYFEIVVPGQTQIVPIENEIEEEKETSAPIVEMRVPLAADELRVAMQSGRDKAKYFTVIFDGKSDLTKSVNRLSLLLSRTPVERYDALDYIDMRLENRGYICLINAKCESAN